VNDASSRLRAEDRSDARGKIRAAYLYECRGVAQQVLADVFGVNQGRINEALTAIRRAAGAAPVQPEENGQD